MNKKGFTLVEVIAAVALMAILIGLAGTNLIKKYNESKREAIIMQEGQLVQSGDMVVQDYCKDPLSEGYQLQCDNYYQSYEDGNNNLIIEDNTYTKYICVKDLKKLGYYSEELKYSGVDCSGVVIYKIDYDTDLQKDSYSVIKCGEDYVTEVENVNDYLTNFKECFETQNTGQPEEEKKYLLTVNFTELTPNGMKVGTSHSKEYKKGQSISVDVPEYKTFENEYTPFKHGSSQNDNNFSLNASRTKLTGTMPEGNAIINIVYSASTYVLTVNYKEFNDVQGNINFPSKQYTMYYGEEVKIPHENVANFKIISPNNFTYQMQQEDAEINVIYQQIDFNLTYNSNGGTACSSRKITYNKAFGTLCNPTRTGYTFDGWYLNGSKVTSATVNTNYNNVTLTAKWNANKYVVIYDCNGGTPTNNYSSEHTYDQVSNLANNQCKKTGSVFTQWKDNEGNTYTNQKEIKNLRSANNDSITLTAQWEPQIYHIVFKPNGGSGTMEKMTLIYGQVVNLTANSFKLTGHRFTGWSGSDGKSYTDKAEIVNLTTEHQSTITMTANWSKCGEGTYLADNTCKSCTAGTYSTGGVNSCTACPAGKYTSTSGQSSCSTCSAGTYNTGTGNTSCKTCEAGYYCTGGSNKTTCPSGKYSTAGSNACTTCPTGYYCPGGTDKLACPAGYYSAGGASSCTICPAGSYCPGGNNKYVCSTGTYTNTTGKSSCTTCSAGTYNTGTGNTTCKSCEVGYYCTGGSHKAACSAGYYSAGSASSCTICPAGSYCPGATNKYVCTTGTYTNTTGKSSCSTCPSGQYNTGTGNTTCKSCEAGYYCTGGSHKAACSAGYYTAGGASSCSVCPSGSYCPGATNKYVCTAGTYTNTTGKSSCTTCPSGQYNTGTGNTSCKSCDVGYYCTGGSNKVACSAGYYSAGGASSCTICPAGSYCPGTSNKYVCSAGTYTNTTGKSSCTTCSAGTYNTGTGNTTCKSCEVGYYCTGGAHKAACSAGYYSAGSASSCTICPAGSYCPGTSNKYTCSAGTYTNTTGKTSCTTCSAGTYNTGTGNTSCKTCEAGYYCTGGSNRAACSAGYYSAGGASSCSICPSGSYCPGATNKYVCTAGTYTNTTGKTSCTTCPSGQYNTGTGNTSCKSCDVGYYCTGGSNKVACSSGYYSTGGASSCSICTAGYYCPGSTNKNICPAGSYTNGTGKSSCTQCSAGYYNTGNGNTGCTACEVGYYCPGGSSRTACSAGYYSTGRASSCTICPSGSYCPGASSYKVCEAGKYTNTTGKSSCSTCSAGTYNEGTGNTGCSNCPVGYYCSGGAAKNACSAGYYSTGGAASCTICTAGYYCPGATNRYACSRGHTSSQGASACSPITYTVKYSCGSGSGSVSNQTVSYGSTITLKSSGCTRSGYSFIGWTTNSNGTDDGYGWASGWSGTWSYVNGEYGISGNAVQLYPRWKTSTPSTATATFGVRNSYVYTVNTGAGNWRGENSGNTWNSGSDSSYNGGPHYYTYMQEVKTPNFSGTSSQLELYLWVVKDSSQSATSSTQRWAISTTKASSKYGGTNSSVSESGQVDTGTVTISNLKNAGGADYHSIKLNTTKLKPNTTYYVYFWAYESYSTKSFAIWQDIKNTGSAYAKIHYYQ